MGTLQLWAVNIDQARRIFSADPATAQRLRDAAQQQFQRSHTPGPGLLGKLGPLMRRPNGSAATNPDRPTPDDIEDMLAGRYLPPQRLAAAWALFEFWLTLLAVNHSRIELTESELRDFDFDLARHQVPSRYSLSDLFTTDLGITLTRHEGLADGWVTGRQAADMAQAWAPAWAELTEANRRIAEQLNPLLNGFVHRESPDSIGSEPDLIAIYQA